MNDEQKARLAEMTACQCAKGLSCPDRECRCYECDKPESWHDEGTAHPYRPRPRTSLQRISDLEKQLAEQTKRADTAEMHAKVIAGAADRMRAHEQTQDNMLREYLKRAEAAEKRVAELRALVDAATAFRIGDVRIHRYSAEWCIRIDDKAPSQYRATRDEAIALARELATKEPR